MIEAELVRHLLRGATRTILWTRTVIANVVLGLLLLLLGVNLLGLGLSLPRILALLYPDQDPVRVINGFLLFYFIGDFLLRQVLQRPPSLNVRPYLCLPIRRSSVVRLLILRSSVSVFNVLPLLVLVPVAFTVIRSSASDAQTLSWLVFVGLSILGAGYLAVYLERSRLSRPRTVAIAVVAVAAAIVAEVLGAVDLRELSAQVFRLPLDHPGWIAAPFALLLGTVWLNASQLMRHYVPGVAGAHAVADKNSVSSRALERLHSRGGANVYAALELKLLLRNKRARASFIPALLLVALAPLFYIMTAISLDFYPKPSDQPAGGVHQETMTPTERRVRFVVTPGQIPEEAHVYVTGDHTRLGRWRPSLVPLEAQPDGRWSRTIPFEEGTRIRYVFTLGSWETEAKLADGTTPDVDTLVVAADTTILAELPKWKTPTRDIFVDVMLIYMGVLLLGMCMMVYGQYIFAWESNFFDLLLASPVRLDHYLNGKFLLLMGFAVIMIPLAVMLAFISKEVFVLTLPVMLYTVGVNGYMLLYWATFARKRMDLSASILATQGKGANQYLLIIPFCLVPVLFYLPFALAGQPDFGFAFLGVLGALALILHRPMMALVRWQFLRHRYRMAAGFRLP